LPEAPERTQNHQKPRFGYHESTETRSRKDETPRTKQPELPAPNHHKQALDTFTKRKDTCKAPKLSRTKSPQAKHKARFCTKYALPPRAQLPQNNIEMYQ
jgi:hypothetical protein